MRDSEPKIAEKSRLVRMKCGQNWHIPDLSNIIGVITPVYSSVVLAHIEQMTFEF